MMKSPCCCHTCFVLLLEPTSTAKNFPGTAASHIHWNLFRSYWEAMLLAICLRWITSVHQQFLLQCTASIITVQSSIACMTRYLCGSTEFLLTFIRRLGMGQLGRRCLQFLPHHWLLCTLSGGQILWGQVRPSWGCDSWLGGNHTAVADTAVQCHAHECPGCHCHCWSAASAGFWSRRFPFQGRCFLTCVH